MYGFCDGFWVDEIVFGCFKLDPIICAQPPPQGIRLRVWDDIGNWRRSPNRSAYVPGQPRPRGVSKYHSETFEKVTVDIEYR